MIVMLVKGSPFIYSISIYLVCLSSRYTEYTVGILLLLNLASILASYSNLIMNFLLISNNISAFNTFKATSLSNLVFFAKHTVELAPSPIFLIITKLGIIGYKSISVFSKNTFFLLYLLLLIKYIYNCINN